MAAFPNLFGQNADEVLVVDILFAIGEGDEAVVGLLQFLAGEGEAKLFETMPEGSAAGVFAEDEMGLGYANEGGGHDLVAEGVGQHAVLVDAGLVGKALSPTMALLGEGLEVMIWPSTWLVA